MSETSPNTDDNRINRVDDCFAIGSIVNSNSHMDYTVEIFNERDRERPPKPDEYGFGQPVFIRKTVDGTEHVVMGVIYDTQLVDPDQGRTGPRLAQDDQQQFTPGYIEERTTLAGIALLGTARITDDGTITESTHKMPRWTLTVDDVVLNCPDGITREFHIGDDGNLQLAYMERLLDVAGSLGADVARTLIERLQNLFEDETHQRLLSVLERDVRWQSSVDRGVMR